MAKRTNAISMADIARLAGVSQATVSRALGDGLVHPDTRALVREIARREGYTRRKSAPLDHEHTHTVAVVVPHVEDVHGEVSHVMSVELTARVSDELAEHGYDVLLSQATRNRRWRSALLSSGRTDGVIAIGQAVRGLGRASRSTRAAPLVAWGKAAQSEDCCSVSTDDLTGACHAVRHLFELGRRRIVFLGEASLPSIAERYRGYLEGHRQAGFAAPPELTTATSLDSADAATALGGLLDRAVTFDALLAMSDGLAIAAIETLNARGIKTPDDVSVIGWGDTALASGYRPRLTTVRQDTRRAGRVLTHKLLELLAGQKPPSTVLATELVIRESCGGARRTGANRPVPAVTVRRAGHH